MLTDFSKMLLPKQVYKFEVKFHNSILSDDHVESNILKFHRHKIVSIRKDDVKIVLDRDKRFTVTIMDDIRNIIQNKLPDALLETNVDVTLLIKGSNNENNIERYEYVNCHIVEIGFSELDYSSDSELSAIKLTFEYDVCNHTLADTGPL